MDGERDGWAGRDGSRDEPDEGQPERCAQRLAKKWEQHFFFCLTVADFYGTHNPLPRFGIFLSWLRVVL
jgi:hypothetical protein